MRRFLAGIIAGLAAAFAPALVHASDFSQPWTREDRAVVIDAYEYNRLDWMAMMGDRRIVGFINKASDGLPPAYFCKGEETEYRLCKALWYRHAVAKELYQTRRTLAKSLGLKWGAYHLARPGNPVEQAQNFLDFAAPGPDDLLAIDIEDNDPAKWMSLDDAEIFVNEIKRRTGRYPVLYTNGNTAQHIADNAYRYRVLSRLPLWYARYKPEIGMHFPKGNWDNYALWQFATQVNCNKQSCPYRVPGTNLDIDVNVASMSPDELRRAWPFGGLVPEKAETLVAESVPVPFPRDMALAGEAQVRWAAVAAPPPGLTERLFALARTGFSTIETAYAGASAPNAGQTAIANMLAPAKPNPLAQVDMTTTASIAGATGFTSGTRSAFFLKPFDRSGEEFEELFRRTSQDSAAADNDNRSVDQYPMRKHQIDKLLVAPFRVVEAELAK